MERKVLEDAPDGTKVEKASRYVELATGLHYKTASGEWLESSEAIEVQSDGSAQAIRGQHTVIFPPDLYLGQVRVTTPHGKQLRSRVSGIAYFDGSSGKSVLIAEVTNSVGVVHAPNVLIYPNAIMGDCRADIRYTYRRSGFEQDVILRTAPPEPAEYGLDPSSTVLQVLTEFFEPPAPNVVKKRWKEAKSGRWITDDYLDFGGLVFGLGRAFDLGKGRVVQEGARVTKQWLKLADRDWLFEEVPIGDVGASLKRLPRQAAARSGDGESLRTASTRRLLPNARIALHRREDSIKLAQAPLDFGTGFVMDYVAVNSTANLTFKGDTTYYVSGVVNLTGTVTIEGGAVVKFNPSAAGGIYVDSGVLRCDTAQYRPAVFTSMHDNSVGETISGSTGSPSAAADSNFYLQTANFNPDLRHIRMLYSYCGITVMNGTARLSNIQFNHVQYPIYTVDSSSCRAMNILMHDVTQVGAWVYNGKIDFQNATVHKCNQLLENESGASFTATNCIFAAVTNWGESFVGAYNATNAGASLFQTSGAGSHYHAGNTYRDFGTTNVDSALLAILKATTTYPPVVYSNVSLLNSVTFHPQVYRDTAYPDLGYHYDPLDYVFGGVTATSNVIFSAGTAAGWFEPPGSGGFGCGLRIGPNGEVSFNGNATAPCTFARYSTVQEGNGTWADKGWLAGVTTAYGNPNAVNVNYRFTRSSLMANDPNHTRDYYGVLNVRATHSEFWSASMGGYGAYLYFTNCLIDRVSVGGHCDCSFGITLRNCTVRGGALTADRWSSGPMNQLLSVSDVAFDGSSILNNNGNSGNTLANYNSYISGANRILPNGANDVLLSGYNWEMGRFGCFYLPTNSLLINTGSVSSAGVVGLYHFTTATNQTKEGSSRLDIGYHYVAVDNFGNPIDTNGNGNPDYLEDGAGAGQAFSIILTSPAGGSSHKEPANLNLVASLNSWNTIVTNVEFYRSSTQIHSTKTSPYSYGWPLVGAGQYSLTAVARSGGGISVTSSPVAVTVTNLCGF